MRLLSEISWFFSLGWLDDVSWIDRINWAGMGIWLLAICILYFVFLVLRDRTFKYSGALGLLLFMVLFFGIGLFITRFLDVFVDLSLIYLLPDWVSIPQNAITLAGLAAGLGIMYAVSRTVNRMIRGLAR